MLQRSAKATEASKGLPRAIDVRGPWRSDFDGSSGNKVTVSLPPREEERRTEAKQVER